MPFIELSLQDVERRGALLQQMLIPISNVKTGPAWALPQRRSTVCVLGAHEGSIGSSDYQEWRFSTFVPNHRAQYYERWQRSEDNEDLWYLERAYLNIFKYDQATDLEEAVVLLHCDPNEPDNPEHPELPKYKRVPHIHMHGGSEYPLYKAHLALTVGYFDLVLASADTLTQAVIEAVSMVKNEILDKVYNHMIESMT